MYGHTYRNHVYLTFYWLDANRYYARIATGKEVGQGSSKEIRLNLRIGTVRVLRCKPATSALYIMACIVQHTREIAWHTAEESNTMHDAEQA